MAETAVRRNIDRKSSIENEPRTLSYHQLECARDAAMYVVSTRSMEEAMRIFTLGLEPVESVESRNRISITDDDDDDDDDELGCLRDFSQLQRLRDIMSAPF